MPVGAEVKTLSLAYPYLYGYAMNRRSTPVGAEVKILSLVVNKSKLRLQQASFLNLSFVYSLAYSYLCHKIYQNTRFTFFSRYTNEAYTYI